MQDTFSSVEISKSLEGVQSVMVVSEVDNGNDCYYVFLLETGYKTIVEFFYNEKSVEFRRVVSNYLLIFIQN